MSFTTLGLPLSLIETLTAKGYLNPTPIQKLAIPLILENHDLMGAAQTGTGKTAAFVLPILARLVDGEKPKAKRVRALIITPTRELAIQIAENVTAYSEKLDLNNLVIFGGVKTDVQIEELREGKDILIATPGRLLDLYGKHAIKFDQVEFVVLDEADRMLDLGFIDAISEILKLLPSKRQNLMFSATFSDPIRKLAKTFLHNPKEISVDPEKTTAITVKQYIHPVDEDKKLSLLCQLINENKWRQLIVFVNTKNQADILTQSLVDIGLQAVAIHSDKPQSSRLKTFSRFKEGLIPILVATDIAARGLDIDNLPAVINFEIPTRPENYVHRIGRTGRADSNGIAISLVCAREIYELNAVENLIKHPLKRVYLANYAPMYAFPDVADIILNKKKDKQESEKKILQKKTKTVESRNKVGSKKKFAKEQNKLDARKKFKKTRKK